MKNKEENLPEQVSPNTAKNYFYSVRKFLRWAAIGDPGKTKAMQYYRYLQDKGYANSTIANIVYALNHYFQFLGKKIRLTPPKRHKRQPNFLTVEEAQDLVRVIPNLRDRAIVMALLYTGMRVNELCNLDMSDLQLDEQEIVVRDTKNYYDRKVIISEKCVNAFTEYLKMLPDANRQAVFMSQKGSRISRNRVYAMVRKYGRLAGITKKVTPHVLRHTLATNMITHGASVIEVKDQLGHRRLETTVRPFTSRSPKEAVPKTLPKLLAFERENYEKYLQPSQNQYLYKHQPKKGVDHMISIFDNCLEGLPTNPGKPERKMQQHTDLLSTGFINDFQWRQKRNKGKQNKGRALVVKNDAGPSRLVGF